MALQYSSAAQRKSRQPHRVRATFVLEEAQDGMNVSRIFISYRREDSDIWAGRLADELRKHVPVEQVFQDIASIDPGADVPTVLEEALATAAVMLVVIGPRWLSATDKNGRKRLESPADFVPPGGRREFAQPRGARLSAPCQWRSDAGRGRTAGSPEALGSTQRNRADCPPLGQ